MYWLKSPQTTKLPVRAHPPDGGHRYRTAATDEDGSEEEDGEEEEEEEKQAPALGRGRGRWGAARGRGRGNLSMAERSRSGLAEVSRHPVLVCSYGESCINGWGVHCMSYMKY